MIEDYHNKL